MRQIKSAPKFLHLRYLTNTAGSEAKRWSKKTKEFVNVERPQMVEVYNANMGGVDLCDMLLSCYRIRRRTNKHFSTFSITCWVYLLLILGSFTKGTSNSEMFQKKSIMPLLNFQMEIAKGLTFVDKPVNTARRGRPSLDNTDTPASNERSKSSYRRAFY